MLRAWRPVARVIDTPAFCGGIRRLPSTIFPVMPVTDLAWPLP
ncbi:MAG TPA: hypothetical protein VFM93_10165 [Candidatus Limnocylindria bacterium]|nr:hypothetical protein [Candidatus Limnocylindria bacterium]